MRLFRLTYIVRVLLGFGLDEFLFAHPKAYWPRRFFRGLLFWRRLHSPRAVRLRLALEALGPIFVKFGQLLSTRHDILPPDIAAELTLLQDKVSPFPGALARSLIEQALGRPLERLFERFDEVPVASASVAQVHFATLPTGAKVAVKVIRPGILAIIEQDLALLKTFARLGERWLANIHRLRLNEVLAEFERHLHDELDLQKEAANTSQLRRNFIHSPILLVPEVYWDYCARDVMVMQWMEGTPIHQLDRLREQNRDLKKLARCGVEIFFTQAFRDGFFHADMHPGNILIAADGRYIALDLGVVGTLSDTDKHYLAVNFLAFFNRDYRRVAAAHVECGWVPAGTRVEELEKEVRTVCEPMFDRLVVDISVGQALLRLFEASRRFNVTIQPQLVLLQKTLLNIEGLGRQLDPQLDLWQTARPFLQRWMSEQVGWRALVRSIRTEYPYWARALPQWPRKFDSVLTDTVVAQQRAEEYERRWRLQLQKTQRLTIGLWISLGTLLAIGVQLAVA